MSFVANFIGFSAVQKFLKISEDLTELQTV